MIKNFFKVATRSLWRYKSYSLLNIIGLSLGIAFALVIGLWIQDEWSYNRFHENIDQLHQVYTNADWDGIQTYSRTPGPLRDLLREETPEVIAASRLVNVSQDEQILTVGDRKIRGGGIYVDQDFLQMFSYPLIVGDPQTVLQDPTSILITEELGRKLFGVSSPMGKTIKISESIELEVRGILQKCPENSTLQFEWIAPIDLWLRENEWAKTWGNISFATYALLDEHADPAQVSTKIEDLSSGENESLQFFLHPFADVYLEGQFEAGVATGGRIEYVRLFALIAFILLIVACINFTNLATARASRRAKEIGVRKSVGASRSALILQFMGEALVLVLLSLGTALVGTQLLVAHFNELFARDLALDFQDPVFWIGTTVLVLATTLLAGSYPALVMSRQKSVDILKGSVMAARDGGSKLRNALVTLQFAISLALILGTVVIGKQMKFIQQSNLGIDRENLLYTVLPEDLWSEKGETFRSQVLASPAIAAATFTTDDAVSINGSSGDLQWPGKDPEEMLLVNPLKVGNDFLSTMNLSLVAGREFSGDFPADSSNYIINETAVKAMGLEDPLGTSIKFWNGEGSIVGVVKDYHLQSVHHPIVPQIFVYEPSFQIGLWFRTAAGETAAALAHVREVSEQFSPGHPLVLNFVDEEYARLYRNEAITAELSRIFGGVAIAVSLLGQLGLVAYSAERRKKEIGIRKILGASVTEIIYLMSGKFLRISILALLIGLPLGYFLMQNWMQRFAYSVELKVSTLLAIGFMVMTLVVVTVALRCLSVATTNPIHAVRDE